MQRSELLGVGCSVGFLVRTLLCKTYNFFAPRDALDAGAFVLRLVTMGEKASDYGRIFIID